MAMMRKRRITNSRISCNLFNSKIRKFILVGGFINEKNNQIDSIDANNPASPHADPKTILNNGSPQRRTIMIGMDAMNARDKVVFLNMGINGSLLVLSEEAF